MPPVTIVCVIRLDAYAYNKTTSMKNIIRAGENAIDVSEAYTGFPAVC